MPDRSDPSDVHSSGALPTWLFLTAGIVLTLALIGGGLWWLTTGPNDEQTAGDPPVSSPPTTTTPPADLVDRLPQLPGVLNLDSGTVSTTEGEHRKFFGKGEAVVLRERDVKTVTWKGSSRQVGDADVGYTLLVAHNSDSSAAAATARAFGQLGKLHAKPVGRLAGRHDFPTYRLRTGDTTLQFVVYHSGRYTLHLSVVRTGDRDDTWLTGQLKGLVSEVAATLPPDR